MRPPAIERMGYYPTDEPVVECHPHLPETAQRDAIHAGKAIPKLHI